LFFEFADKAEAGPILMVGNMLFEIEVGSLKEPIAPYVVRVILSWGAPVNPYGRRQLDALIMSIGQQPQVDTQPITTDLDAVIKQLSENAIEKLLEIANITGGLAWYGAQDPILNELDILGLIKKDLIRTASGPRTYDQVYWILTDKGKKVVPLLASQKQSTFGKGGYQN
jgi:hypothetical protein